MFYFGCIKEENGIGHYLYVKSRYGCSSEPRAAYDSLEKAGIYPKIDGGFCPGMENEENAYRVNQIEGHSKLTHYNGWTILAFWDRSDDHRGNSNSNFIAYGIYTFCEMVENAKKEFSWIWERFTFDVVEAASGS